MTMTRYRQIDGAPINLTAGKIVCVGRNYLDHIRELNNEIPTEAVLFMKPNTALVALEGKVPLAADKGEIHHELELCLLIGESLSHAEPAQCLKAITAYGLALDLTLRELQSRLKQKGLPWERAKAFDASCPITSLVSCEQGFIEEHQFTLKINGELRQQGNTQNMMRSIADLLSEMSQWFTLLPGDLILTGTPSGVGELKVGDELQLELDGQYRWNAEMTRASE